MAHLAVAVLTLFLVGLASPESVPVRLGGFSEVKDADGNIRKVVNAVASDIKTRAKISQDNRLHPVRYVSQSVAGTNYIVEVRAFIGRETAKVFHASISADLSGEVFTVNGVKSARTGDTLKSF